MQYYIITYGCQMNLSDSERIEALLQKRGGKPAKNEQQADLIVINACSVRQTAVHRVYGKINKYFVAKNPPPHPSPFAKEGGRKERVKRIILAGCLTEKDKNALKDKVSEIWHPDEYFYNESLRGVSRSEDPSLYSGQAPQSRCIQLSSDEIAALPHPATRDSVARNDKTTAYLPIMTGCNNFCSYCVVPFTRGREKSRPAKEIIKEIKSLTKKGYKEIVLLGQNVNSYKSNEASSPQMRGGLRWGAEKATPPPTPSSTEEGRNILNFAALLKTINALPGNFWLSFLTSHPKDMSEELVETIAKCKKVIPYVHLPVQSGDNEILRKMNRRYSVAHYKNLIKKIRVAFKKYRPAFPPVAVTTDIIVGFPGETKKQFQNTLKLAKDIKFDMIYFAKYSPRPGTAAARLKDNVPPKEKVKRWKMLNEVLKKTALESNKKYIGKIVPVLTNSGPLLCKRRAGVDFLFGKTITGKNIKIENPHLKIGQIVEIKITNATPWSLKGKPPHLI
ncbi:MAG: MiaB/RimO family radical SAM methylthiotransferase [Candidatus Portnoybacteria bacterium]|nr:MiaB/RimO family radical SAM methylthiotransferase [Candidatus Portnoybacteria bacterium]